MSDRVTPSSVPEDDDDFSDVPQGMHPRVQSFDGSEPMVRAHEARWLLHSLELEQPTPILSVTHVSPALIIAVFQSLFLLELDDLRPTSDTFEDQLHNITVLIDALREYIRDLPPMSAERIVRRDPVHLSRLLNLFLSVHTLQLEQQGAGEGNAPAVDTGAASSTSSPVDKHDYVERYLDSLVAEMSIKKQLPKPASNQFHAEDIAALPPSARTAHVAPEIVASAADRQNAGDVARRLQNVARQAGTDSRTTKPALRTAYCGTQGFTATRAMRAVTKNRSRDAKIEQLRTKRFVESVRDFAVSSHLADSSYLACIQRQELSARLARARQDAAELRKIMRDNDATSRAHFVNYIHSLASSRRGIVESQTRSQAEAAARRSALERYNDSVKTQLEVASAMTSWRRQARFVPGLWPAT
jgi:hypothetical protein